MKGRILEVDNISVLVLVYIAPLTLLLLSFNILVLSFEIVEIPLKTLTMLCFGIVELAAIDDKKSNEYDDVIIESSGLVSVHQMKKIEIQPLRAR